MSLQRALFNFVAYYQARPSTAKGLNLVKLRARDMPEPQTKRTWGCQYEAGTLAGVRVTYVRPANIQSGKVLVHLHGGLYAAGIGELHWWLISRLCHEVGCLGVMVDYRLAPEHPFPAALDDTVAVLNALVAAHGPEKLVVSGDSAGGGLAVASAMKQRDDGQAVPAKLVLLSPWLDITMHHPGIPAQEKKDRILARPGVVEAGKRYANGMDPKAPYLSPVNGDLSGLPPMVLQIGTYEMLLPDCRAFRDKALAQNVSLLYQEHPKMFHIWTLLFPLLPEGEEALQEVLQFIR
jgi:monoterpene epsilon-lactone hydrolase